MYTTITGLTIKFPRSLFKIMPNTGRELENVPLKLEMLSLAYSEIIGILEKSKGDKNDGQMDNPSTTIYTAILK